MGLERDPTWDSDVTIPYFEGLFFAQGDAPQFDRLS